MCLLGRRPCSLPRLRVTKGLGFDVQVSILPFDIIGIVIDSSGLARLRVLRVVRLLRLFKLIRVFKTSRCGTGRRRGCGGQ